MVVVGLAEPVLESLEARAAFERRELEDVLAVGHLQTSAGLAQRQAVGVEALLEVLPAGGGLQLLRDAVLAQHVDEGAITAAQSRDVAGGQRVGSRRSHLAIELVVVAGDLAQAVAALEVSGGLLPLAVVAGSGPRRGRARGGRG